MSAKTTCRWCYEPTWECVCDLPDDPDPDFDDPYTDDDVPGDYRGTDYDATDLTDDTAVLP